MNPYLKTKVMTAKPEELRLMLIEGGLKFSRQAAQALEEKDFEGLFTAAQRAKAIALELSSSMNREVNPELCDRVSALYLYIYKLITNACMNRESAPLKEAIELLDYERETWVLAIEKMKTEAGMDTATIDANRVPPVKPQTPVHAADSFQPSQAQKPGPGPGPSQAPYVPKKPIKSPYGPGKNIAPRPTQGISIQG